MRYKIIAEGDDAYLQARAILEQSDARVVLDHRERHFIAIEGVSDGTLSALRSLMGIDVQVESVYQPE